VQITVNKICDNISGVSYKSLLKLITIKYRKGTISRNLGHFGKFVIKENSITNFSVDKTYKKSCLRSSMLHFS
jgi:hypothetical protein